MPVKFIKLSKKAQSENTLPLPVPPSRSGVCKELWRFSGTAPPEREQWQDAHLARPMTRWKRVVPSRTPTTQLFYQIAERFQEVLPGRIYLTQGRRGNLVGRDTIPHRSRATVPHHGLARARTSFVLATKSTKVTKALCSLCSLWLTNAPRPTEPRFHSAPWSRAEARPYR